MRTINGGLTTVLEPASAAIEFLRPTKGRWGSCIVYDAEQRDPGALAGHSLLIRPEGKQTEFLAHERNRGSDPLFAVVPAAQTADMRHKVNGLDVVFPQPNGDVTLPFMFATSSRRRPRG
jgi:hypothetical protein